MEPEFAAAVMTRGMLDRLLSAGRGVAFGIDVFEHVDALGQSSAVAWIRSLGREGPFRSTDAALLGEFVAERRWREASVRDRGAREIPRGGPSTPPSRV